MVLFFLLSLSLYILSLDAILFAVLYFFLLGRFVSRRKAEMLGGKKKYYLFQML